MNQSTSLTELIRQRFALTTRIEALQQQVGRADELLRLKVSRALWGYGMPGGIKLEEVEAELREEFPELRATLGHKTHRETAAWLMAK